MPYIPLGWGITGLVMLFLVCMGLFLRKKEVGKSGLVLLAVLAAGFAWTLYSNAGTKVYIIEQDMKISQAVIYGNSEMKFIYHVYKLEPVDGNIIVINRSLISLYVKQVCYTESAQKKEPIELKSGEWKNIRASAITYGPDDVPPPVKTFTIGQSEIEFQVAKNPY